MIYAIVISLVLFFSNLDASAQTQPKLIQIVKPELERFMDSMKSQPNPPYYISYYFADNRNTRISSTDGVLKSKYIDSSRTLDIQVRVGDYKFDNTHIIRGSGFDFTPSIGRLELPFNDDEQTLRNILWLATDKAYKNATERYEKALTNAKVKVKEDDTSADFSFDKPVKIYGKGSLLSSNPDKIIPILNRLSKKFEPYKWIYSANVTFMGDSRKKILITSEGTETESYENYFYIFISASTKADDGMDIPLYKSYFAYNPDSLPSEEVIAKDIDILITQIDGLRNAPLAETFTGPAMLSGEASGVFFHEIFGHRVEGFREKDPSASQTFKKMVGEKILPSFIDVVFDPTRKYLDHTSLAGFYDVDDEGVPAQRVDVVQDGIFKNFLMSRTPIEGFDHSNGHGRKAPGYTPVTRQSNLIVLADSTMPVENMKNKLREIAKEQDKEYGLYFTVVEGGFTFIDRTIPNAFNVMPLVVYKIYVDGRPDELVRGVDLIGTPLTTFSNIVAAGNDMATFNGVCGAESGGVPVSASSPTLLVSRIEVQKKYKSQSKPPILPAP
jgi:predicted Zn-dependent protease